MVEVRDLNVGDLLGLLESAQEDVVQEVRSLLKETFHTVKEGWLVTGLLDYFFASNSGRLLDILLGVSEPHDRHLLDRLTEGLKGPDRFRYTCLLLYAVRRQPAPMWLRKLAGHGAMRELLNVLNTEEDILVLVSGVMVLVMLLPSLPMEMGHLHLTVILDIFCRLVRWTPKRDPEVDLQPYLQVAVYSLFHRLYALYPCHFLTCLRSYFSRQSSSACFFTTLKPMMEKVRLHPLLITENKESELMRNRWIGMEAHQLVLECAKVCLDPMEATNDEVSGSFFTVNGGSDTSMDSLPSTTSWMFNSAEHNFWSPSLAQPSPAVLRTPRGSSSVPHTPVYPILTPNQRSVCKVAESPPEAAIEATPETTPFTSPTKMEGHAMGKRRRMPAMRVLTLNTGSGDVQNSEAEVNSSPMSPAKKEQAPFRFPENQGQDLFLRAGKSTLLQSKLQQLQRERQQSQKEGSTQIAENNNGSNVSKEEEEALTKDGIDERQVCDKVVEDSADSKDSDTISYELNYRLRRRKVSVYDSSAVDMTLLPDAINRVSNGNSELDFSNELIQNDKSENSEGNYKSTPIDRRISEERESESSESRRSSDEQQVYDTTKSDEPTSGGLGVPSQRSITDLFKNMKTMRLRFLSQCGPPPDLPVRLAMSPVKSVCTPEETLQRSTSCPQLTVDDPFVSSRSLDGRIRKESAKSSLTLSPTRQAVLTSEATTQTEESSVINPYEQLLDALTSGHTGPSQPKNNKANSEDQVSLSPSPHQVLDDYLQYSTKVGKDSKNLLWQQQSSGSIIGDGLRNHVRLMMTMLLFERYKREIHAERNRRLLGRAKRAYALEEEQRGLKEEVVRLEGEISHLKLDLRNLQVISSTKEQQLQSALTQQQIKVTQLQVECDSAQHERDLLRQHCKTLAEENEDLLTKLNETQANLSERERQITVQARLAEDNKLLHNQVEVLHMQLAMLGEVHEKYRHKLHNYSVLGSPGTKKGLDKEREAALLQVQGLQESCRTTSANLDAALERVAQLDRIVAEKDDQIESLHRAVRAAKEAGAEQCRAAERRCQALAATNQTLESHILEHNDRIDRLVRQVRRSQRGKSVCSDGFDIDLELSASPSSASSTATSPPDEPCMSGPLLARQPVALNKLDALIEDNESEGHPRRKT